MNKEELNAIKILESEISSHMNRRTIFTDYAIEKVLNLVNRQHEKIIEQRKEIDEKDKIIAEYNKRGQTLNNLMNVKDTYMYKEICKNFIPKDKIRKLEDMWNDNIWNATDEESEAKAEIIRDVYRGLLDE